MSSSDPDRVVSVTLTHVALALQPVLYYTVTPRTHALALALPCPPSTSQSHVHVRARHEPCGRRAGEDDEHLGVAGLHQTSLCCSCFGLTGQDELQPAGLLACLLPSLPCAYAFIALQERTEHICCTCSFLYLYDVAKTSGWIVFWAAGSRSE
jgi:hypothetical protein